MKMAITFLLFVFSATLAQAQGLSLAAEAALEKLYGPRTQAPFVTATEARRVLVANRARLWKDPASVVDARISEPVICPTGRGTCVCIEANARNGFGGYTGMKRNGIRFLTPTEFEVLGELGEYAKCEKLAAFPEMNGRQATR